MRGKTRLIFLCDQYRDRLNLSTNFTDVLRRLCDCVLYENHKKIVIFVKFKLIVNDFSTNDSLIFWNEVFYDLQSWVSNLWFSTPFIPTLRYFDVRNTSLSQSSIGIS